MKCRSCGAEIAANALICYKCGTATSEPKIKAPAKRTGLGRGSIAGLILLGLALAAVVREVACGSLL
jgi:ribosomal protein L40E